MKASLKFREDQNPLFRAKVPINIIGLPFQSGILAGESNELSLNLSTFFESGPSFKISYRPNDTWNPFSLVIKTGTGPFGSPVSSSMIMSAEFNLLSKGINNNNNLNPSFMLHFKPQFGDFSVKKSQSSSQVTHVTRSIQNGGVSSDDDGSTASPTPTPAVDNGVFYGKKITVLPPVTASAVAGVFSGLEVAARTKLPVRSRAVVSFRWGVRVPAEIKSGGGESTAGINFRKIPFLVMNKVGIEQVDDGDGRSKNEGATGKAGMDLGNADVAEACLGVKRQLEVLQSENGHLKRAVEGLREEIGGGKLLIGELNSGKFERNGIKSGSSGNKTERRSIDKKSVEGDASEELKKALKGATSGVGA
ncbi:hypothetical protein OIU85_017073 [Salix viminalis]|uniref:Uncharacterized protein n=1 Tax=Salix viminalis TaxID=40686 RepID=A0A9Q0ZQC4_SALVM|nr:hypothetical protein OIU85_017073 [Salix viminalis]